MQLVGGYTRSGNTRDARPGAGSCGAVLPQAPALLVLPCLPELAFSVPGWQLWDSASCDPESTCTTTTGQPSKVACICAGPYMCVLDLDQEQAGTPLLQDFDGDTYCIALSGACCMHCRGGCCRMVKVFIMATLQIVSLPHITSFAAVRQCIL